MWCGLAILNILNNHTYLEYQFWWKLTNRLPETALESTWLQFSTFLSSQEWPLLLPNWWNSIYWQMKIWCLRTASSKPSTKDRALALQTWDLAFRSDCAAWWTAQWFESDSALKPLRFALSSESSSYCSSSISAPLLILNVFHSSAKL